MSTKQWIVSGLIVWHLVSLTLAAIPAPTGLDEHRGISVVGDEGLHVVVQPWADAARDALWSTIRRWWRASHLPRQLTGVYVEAAGLEQQWRMFGNPPKLRQYIRVRHTWSPAGSRPGTRGWRQVETRRLFPGDDPADRWSPGSYLTGFFNKAVSNAMDAHAEQLMRARRRGRSFRAGPDHLRALIRYAEEEFLDTLPAGATLLSTELWYGEGGVCGSPGPTSSRAGADPSRHRWGSAQPDRSHRPWVWGPRSSKTTSCGRCGRCDGHDRLPIDGRSRSGGSDSGSSRSPRSCMPRFASPWGSAVCSASSACGTSSSTGCRVAWRRRGPRPSRRSWSTWGSGRSSGARCSSPLSSAPSPCSSASSRWKPSGATFVLALLQASWNAVPLSSAAGVFRVFLFCLVWVDCGRVWSVDRWLARRRGAVEPVSEPALPIWPLRLLRFQVCLIYLNSGVWKLFGAPWRDGTAMYYALSHSQFGRFPSPPEMLDPVLALGTYAVLLWELAFHAHDSLPSHPPPRLVVRRRLARRAPGRHGRRAVQRRHALGVSRLPRSSRVLDPCGAPKGLQASGSGPSGGSEGEEVQRTPGAHMSSGWCRAGGPRRPQAPLPYGVLLAPRPVGVTGDRPARHVHALSAWPSSEVRRTHAIQCCTSVTVPHEEDHDPMTLKRATTRTSGACLAASAPGCRCDGRGTDHRSGRRNGMADVSGGPGGHGVLVARPDHLRQRVSGSRWRGPTALAPDPRDDDAATRLAGHPDRGRRRHVSARRPTASSRWSRRVVESSGGIGSATAHRRDAVSPTGRVTRSPPPASSSPRAPA